MPGYKTHLLGGTVAFAVLYYLTTKGLHLDQTPPQALLLLSTTLLGSLIPDLDIGSKIQRLFYTIIIVAFLAFLFTHQGILLCVTAGLAVTVALLRHRTILHHPVFLAILPLPVIYYMSNNNYSLSSTLMPTLFFIIGAWSHILLDFGLKGRPKKR